MQDIHLTLDKYGQAQDLRRPLEGQFRLNAAYCLPRDYSRWQGASTGAEHNRTSSDVQSRFLFDNTGVKAVAKYGAICKRLINPDNAKYHRLVPDDDALAKIPAVVGYFGALTDCIFRKRHNPFSNFGTTQQEVYTSIGVYGTGPKSIHWNPAARTFRYKAWPMYNIYFLVDDEGGISDVFRKFSLTKRQFALKFPQLPMPSKLKALQDSDVKTSMEFVHYVWKRVSDYDPKALGPKRMKWGGCYFCKDEPMYIGDEEGFVEQPYTLPRTLTSSGDIYGYSPAELAFPALGGVNAVKKTYMKVGHKAVDPPLLAHDDGVLSGRIDMRPGKVTYGGVNSQGQALVRELQSGSNFQVAENIIADERNDINDPFLVTLFQILTDTPEMTAAEVYERFAEKAALFAPTMGALQEEDQAPQIQRELALLVENGEMPPPPPELIEARGGYRVTYTNPMSKALHSEEVSGFMRWLQMLSEAANLQQNPEPLDWANFDEAAPAVGYHMNVPAAWVNTPDAVKAIRAKRGEQMQTEQMLQAAPALASVAATAAKTQQGKVK